MSKLPPKTSPKNLISRDYGISPTSPFSSSNKAFQRKQSPSNRDRLFSISRKRKTDEQLVSTKTPVATTSCDIQEIQRMIRSKSNLPLNAEMMQKVGTAIKIERIDSPDTKFQPESKSIEKNREMKLQGIRQKEDEEMIRRLRKEIVELRNENLGFSREMRGLKQQNESQRKQNEALTQRVKMLNEAVRESRGKLEEKARESKKQHSVMEEQQKSIEKLERALGEKEAEISGMLAEKKDREELEKALSEMNQNFDEIFSGPKTPDLEEVLQSQFERENLHEQLLALKEKAKYQEIEIAMLRRFKAEMENSKVELDRLKLQNRMLLGKIRAMPKPKTKHSEEDLELSLSLSK